jgi:hypothetical protein
LTPLALNAGNQVMITSRGPDEITVSRFSVGKPDQRREVSTRVDDVIRAIAEVGGTYPDVVQALQEAKARGLLPSRFEVDALPTDGRAYDRMAGGQQEADERSPGRAFSRASGRRPHRSAQCPPTARGADHLGRARFRPAAPLAGGPVCQDNGPGLGVKRRVDLGIWGLVGGLGRRGV